MPPAYWIVNATVTDPDAYALYRAANAAPLAAYGAEFLVRGGPQQVTEGKMHPRTVVVRFPSLQAATECYHSAAYQAAIALRRGASTGAFCIVEGYDGPQP
jgi:uncharacterized protein (DUF1330 family)